MSDAGSSFIAVNGDDRTLGRHEHPFSDREPPASPIGPLPGRGQKARTRVTVGEKQSPVASPQPPVRVRSGFSFAGSAAFLLKTVDW